MRCNKLFQGLLFVLALVFSGCISLPKEAPELSAEIGGQIITSRASHLALLGQYMHEKHDRIDAFIAREWIPEFARAVFASPTVKSEWERIVSNNDKPARLEFIVGLGSRLQQKINAKRLELMQPIDQLEQMLTALLNEHYDQMLAANATLTAYLDSASSVKVRQHRVLTVLKVDGKLAGYMAKADDIVGKIVAGKDAYQANREKIEDILDKLKQGLGEE